MRENTATASRDPTAVALEAAVDGAYLAFRRHRSTPPPLDVCGDCCVSEHTAQRLRDEPIAKLTPQDFREYNGSAKSEVQLPREVGHFLPRMLALLADGQEVHHSLEIALDRLGRCPTGSWNAEEQAALDRFALTYFDAVLFGALAHRQFDNPLGVLLMFHIGGLSIAPLLQRWQDCEHPSSAIQYVHAGYWDFWKERRYANAFADDRPAFQQQVHDWLLDPVCRRRFAQRLAAPGFLAMAAHERDTGCMSFAMMTDAVFDQLTG